MTISLLKTACGLALMVLAAAPGAFGQASPNRTWLWTTFDAPVEARHLALNVTSTSEDAASSTLHFDCAIRSDHMYNDSRLVFEVRDAEDAIVSSGEQRLDILAGANRCQVSYDASSLGLGTYHARFFVSHPKMLDESSQTLTLRKVNAENLLENLAIARGRLDELEKALAGFSASASSMPYLRLKAGVAADVLKLAEANGQAEEWETLEQRLGYVNTRLDSIHAGIIFGASSPERLSGAESPSLHGLTIGEGGFSAGGRPIFLFGGALPTPDAEALARLRRYELNAASLTLAPEENPNSTQTARIQQFFDAAVSQNISVTVQLDPSALSADFLMNHPDIKHDGHVDIGRPEVRAEWEAYVSRLGPVLNGQPMLAGVSLAEDPHFHFSGLEVRDGFLEFIRSSYPDRLTLNRAWRAKLGQLEDIVLWSTDPLDGYQEHRPYQFDWQTYHQNLGNAYFDWARQLAASHFPTVPLMTTLPDTVFTKGETRYGVNRERLADLMQMTGCTAVAAADDPIYAMRYPEPSAYYNLLKSLQPEQPLVNLNNVLELSATQNADQNYRFVHAAMWEAVLSGLNAAMVPMDSLIFQQPEALEAFATAALDINRLAPLVQAFQAAPADVGVLFSYASKVYDDGDPHLLSALNAYEGAAFGGYNLRFISEEQCANGALDNLKILVLPNTPALGDAAFKKISEFVEAGGTVARTGAPIPYNERGFSRGDLIRNTANTVLVRGLNLPTEYLHAMDAATVLGALPQIPRAITRQGYPVEGVKTRYVEHEGNAYLYVVNMRKEPINVSLATQTRKGRDLIQGRDVEFPATLEPLVPLLLRLEPVVLEMKVTANGGA